MLIDMRRLDIIECLPFAVHSKGRKFRHVGVLAACVKLHRHYRVHEVFFTIRLVLLLKRFPAPGIEECHPGTLAYIILLPLEHLTGIKVICVEEFEQFLAVLAVLEVLP